jgi:hypothetical protein
VRELICPHCHGNVSYGANVCRGCQAEVEYGTPRFVMVIVMIFSVFIGVKTASALADWLGWIVGIAIFFAGVFAANTLFRERVNFKRLYRTK